MACRDQRRRTGSPKKSRFTEEQIAYALRLPKNLTPIEYAKKRSGHQVEVGKPGCRTSRFRANVTGFTCHPHRVSLKPASARYSAHCSECVIVQVPSNCVVAVTHTTACCA